MNQKQFLHVGTLSVLLCIFNILVVDKQLALFVETLPSSVSGFFQRGTELIEVVFLWEISKYAFGILLFVIGAMLWFKKEWRSVGNLFLVVSSAHMLSRFVSGVLKTVFGRHRPYEILESGDWNTQFFDGGGSFPSGHAAHFWGLFIPLMIAFPRLRIPLLIIPVFISLARVAVNDHFLGDVIGSFALSALISFGVMKIFQANDNLNYYITTQIK